MNTTVAKPLLQCGRRSIKVPLDYCKLNCGVDRRRYFAPSELTAPEFVGSSLAWRWSPGDHTHLFTGEG